jgi:hypothetical protein
METFISRGAPQEVNLPHEIQESTLIAPVDVDMFYTAYDVVKVNFLNDGFVRFLQRRRMVTPRVEYESALPVVNEVLMPKTQLAEAASKNKGNRSSLAFISMMPSTTSV